MSFTDLVQQDTPRLVVKFRREDDQELFGPWGIIGSVKTLTLIGSIIKVQSELLLMEPHEARLPDRYCPESALCIAWLEYCDDKIVWFVHPDIPVIALVGMLDLLKLEIIGKNAMQAQSIRGRHNGLLGPDGTPWRS